MSAVVVPAGTVCGSAGRCCSSSSATDISTRWRCLQPAFVQTKGRIFSTILPLRATSRCRFLTVSSVLSIRSLSSLRSCRKWSRSCLIITGSKKFNNVNSSSSDYVSIDVTTQTAKISLFSNSDSIDSGTTIRRTGINIDSEDYVSNLDWFGLQVINADNDYYDVKLKLSRLEGINSIYKKAYCFIFAI